MMRFIELGDDFTLEELGCFTLADFKLEIGELISLIRDGHRSPPVSTYLKLLDLVRESDNESMPTTKSTLTLAEKIQILLAVLQLILSQFSDSDPTSAYNIYNTLNIQIQESINTGQQLDDAQVKDACDLISNYFNPRDEQRE